MTEYRLRALERELSFVVTPVDTYSGGCVAGSHVRAEVKGPFKLPLAKREGHFVFFDLPRGEHEVSVSSDRYFPEAITARTGEGPYTVLLIPSRRYGLEKGMTWVEGSFQPNATVYVMPKGAPGLKLARGEDDKLVVMTLLPWDLTNRHIAVGREREICFVKERLSTFTYKLSTPLLKRHEKNAPITTVSLGRTGEDGYLLCPVANLMPEHKEVLLWQVGEEGMRDCREIKITYGRGNGIYTE